MKKSLILGICLSFMGISSLYAGSGGGKVESIAIWGDLVTFSVENHKDAPPECPTAGAFGFSLSEPGGNAKLSALLSARTAGRTVTVWGGNECGFLFGSAEHPYETAGAVFY